MLRCEWIITSSWLLRGSKGRRWQVDPPVQGERGGGRRFFRTPLGPRIPAGFTHNGSQFHLPSRNVERAGLSLRELLESVCRQMQSGDQRAVTSAGSIHNPLLSTASPAGQLQPVHSEHRTGFMVGIKTSPQQRRDLKSAPVTLCRAGR